MKASTDAKFHNVFGNPKATLICPVKQNGTILRFSLIWRRSSYKNTGVIIKRRHYKYVGRHLRSISHCEAEILGFKLK